MLAIGRDGMIGVGAGKKDAKQRARPGLAVPSEHVPRVNACARPRIPQLCACRCRAAVTDRSTAPQMRPAGSARAGVSSGTTDQ